MATNYKVTDLFCIIDEFCKHFDAENAGNLLEDNSICKIYVCIIIVRFLYLRKFVVRHALINHHAVEWYHIIMLNGGIAQFLQGVHIEPI